MPMTPRRYLLLLVPLIPFGSEALAQSRPHAGPMPDETVKVRPLRYESITRGTQNYRPIEPMPWGDVNRRVAPPGALPGGPPAPQKRGALPGAKDIRRDAEPKQ